MRLVYFAHDLNDPGGVKRVAMLQAGGVDVMLSGFWRGRKAPRQVAGCEVIALGRTFDSRLAHRALTTLYKSASARTIARTLGGADVILARSLEMLMVASAVRRQLSPKPALVYEVLDIHRTLLSSAYSGRMLRRLERALMRGAALLITSSPAFLREYFEPVHFAQLRIPALVVENKRFTSQSTYNRQYNFVPPAPPWRIGWFGVIRCRRSFELLGRLAKRRPDLLQIELRGRITAPIHNCSDAMLQSGSAAHFGGSYSQDELEGLYNSVHFNWTIDYFEEGGNSEWLLPNRLYEGGSFGAVPLARRHTETGRWLGDKKIGVLFDDPVADLEHFLESMTPAAYLALKRAASQATRSLFVADQSDCERLVTALQRAAGRSGAALFGHALAAA